MTSCKKHERDLTIYDTELNQNICDRCALFDPIYKSHTFIEAKDLPHYSQQLINKFTMKLKSLQIQSENSTLNSPILQEMSLKKISSEVASINKTYSELIRELQIQRDAKIHQVQRNINSIVSQSKRSITALVSKEYKQIIKTSQNLNKLFQQKNYQQICQILNNNLLNKKLQTIQKDLQIIYFEFNNKITFINNQIPYFLPLTKKQSQQILINNLENEFVNMFDSMKQSRVSIQSDKTSISFGSSQSKQEQKSQQLNQKLDSSIVSIKNTLNTLKVHSKSEVKNLYIKNSIKNITMTQLDMNNNQALQAIKKCSLNNFVSKLDLSYNQITQKLLIQLKRQKIQSKYLKHIIVKGIKLDSRELKKQGILIQSSKPGQGIITIGTIKIEY